jgi:excisionase family DNA binding protein
VVITTCINYNEDSLKKIGDKFYGTNYPLKIARLGDFRYLVWELKSVIVLNRKFQIASERKRSMVHYSNDIDPMLTTSEVAHILSVHINTVRRWSNQGILKAYRIGSRGDRRFRREDIASFFSQDGKSRNRKVIR